jgi:uncharacterized protein (TIGR02246 family)
MALEAELTRALLASDADSLARIYTPDAMHAHLNGVVDGPGLDALVDRVRRRSSVYHSIDIDNVLVRTYSDSAIVTGIARIDMTADGEARKLEYRFTRAWVKVDGAWRLASHQSGGVRRTE